MRTSTLFEPVHLPYTLSFRHPITRTRLVPALWQFNPSQVRPSTNTSIMGPATMILAGARDYTLRTRPPHLACKKIFIQTTINLPPATPIMNHNSETTWVSSGASTHHPPDSLTWTLSGGSTTLSTNYRRQSLNHKTLKYEGRLQTFTIAFNGSWTLS